VQGLSINIYGEKGFRKGVGSRKVKEKGWVKYSIECKASGEQESSSSPPGGLVKPVIKPQALPQQSRVVEGLEEPSSSPPQQSRRAPQALLSRAGGLLKPSSAEQEGSSSRRAPQAAQSQSNT
jgi:hypothetical protein